MNPGPTEYHEIDALVTAACDRLAARPDDQEARAELERQAAALDLAAGDPSFTDSAQADSARADSPRAEPPRVSAKAPASDGTSDTARAG